MYSDVEIKLEFTEETLSIFSCILYKFPSFGELFVANLARKLPDSFNDAGFLMFCIWCSII